MGEYLLVVTWGILEVHGAEFAYCNHVATVALDIIIILLSKILGGIHNNYNPIQNIGWDITIIILSKVSHALNNFLSFQR